MIAQTTIQNFINSSATVNNNPVSDWITNQKVDGYILVILIVVMTLLNMFIAIMTSALVGPTALLSSYVLPYILIVGCLNTICFTYANRKK